MQVFEKMREWGLGSLPGGGAEILVEEIRTKIALEKLPLMNICKSMESPTNSV